MRAQDRAAARRQLDKRLKLLENSDTLIRPPKGWLRAVREALGMTAQQLADRLGISQPRVLAIEKAEVNGSITLRTLERAAQALDCRLVYALVPREPLEQLVEKRASDLARRRLRSARHNMALEAQGVDLADERAQLEQLTRRILERAGSELWREE